MPRKSVNILDRYSDLPLDSPERRTIQNRNAQRVYRARKAKRMIPALPEGDYDNGSRSSSGFNARKCDKRPHQNRANSFEFILWSPNGSDAESLTTLNSSTKPDSSTQTPDTASFDDDMFSGFISDGLDTQMQITESPEVSTEFDSTLSKNNTFLDLANDGSLDSFFEDTITLAPFALNTDFDILDGGIHSSQPSPPMWASEISSGFSSFSEHVEDSSRARSTPLSEDMARRSDTPATQSSSEQEHPDLRMSKSQSTKAGLRHSLHTAAECNRVEVLQILLDTGCDVNVRDGREKTPLHFAALAGHCDAVQLLCDYGSDINATDSRGRTPVHLATRNGHASCVRMLLNLGADMWAQDDGHSTAD